MKRTVLFLAACMISALPARADNRKAVCEFLPVKEHFVGADYVPGVDVHGNPVVPAEVKELSQEFVDVIRFPVTVDLAEELDQELPIGTELEAPVAMIEIHKDSRVLYNGEDLTSEVYAFCDKEPFNINAAVAESEARAAPEPLVVKAPEKKPVKEEIIWGEGY